MKEYPKITMEYAKIEKGITNRTSNKDHNNRGGGKSKGNSERGSPRTPFPKQVTVVTGKGTHTGCLRGL